MVLEILGVVNDEPVNNKVPPVGALYQSIKSNAPAEIVTVPVPQRLPFTGEKGAGGILPDNPVTCTLKRLTQPVALFLVST